MVKTSHGLPKIWWQQPLRASTFLKCMIGVTHSIQPWPTTPHEFQAKKRGDQSCPSPTKAPTYEGAGRREWRHHWELSLLRNGPSLRGSSGRNRNPSPLAFARASMRVQPTKKLSARDDGGRAYNSSASLGGNHCRAICPTSNPGWTYSTSTPTLRPKLNESNAKP